MPETLFLQFFSRRKNAIYNLLNGFSDTYDLCREHGELVWYPDEPDTTQWYRYDRYAANALPITRGTIYVSALDVNHLYQSWVWAREYPDVQFVVGGPVASERDTRSKQWDPAYVLVEDPAAIPDNLTLTGKSVEEWFGVPEFSGPWRMDIPEEIPAGSRIYFSYTLDNGCFWSRCTYCNIGLHDQRRKRRRRHMDFEFADLPFDGVKLVRLNTGSITPAQIRDLLPALPRADGFEYRTFMRSAGPENRALQAAADACDGDLPSLVLGIGLEFPTRRMLAHVNKGFEPDEIIQGLEICQANGILSNGNMILGWDNLTPQDIDELDTFMQRVPTGALKSIQIRWLHAHPFTPIHDHYHGRPTRFGPFYEGFQVELEDAGMIALNRQAADILARYAVDKHYKPEGLDTIYEKLQNPDAGA